MESAVTPQLGQHLKDRRLELGWSLRHLEERSRVHNSLITRIEQGRIKDPSLDSLRRICAAMDLSATRLLIDDGQLDPPSHGHLIDLIAPHLPNHLVEGLREHYLEMKLEASGGEQT
jgi:transcriptional regulator with XRE-family HTH domain